MAENKHVSFEIIFNIAEWSHVMIFGKQRDAWLASGKIKYLQNR